MMKTAKKSPKKQENPYFLRAERYISGVLSGKIGAGKWIKLACERHRRDIASSITRQFPYRFDAEMGARVCKFVENLPHTKGKWAKKDPLTGEFRKIRLEDWQVFFLISLFGWVRKDNGKRRFRKARLYVPRKNAKTTLLAAVGLYMLCADREPGAEVYCGATSEQQAKTLFQMVRQMCLKTPGLVARFGLLVNVASVVKEDGSIFKPVIGKPGDGDSPHCAIIDEYHEHPTSDQLDTMETGMGAREQPMSIIISTAGSNTASPCRDDWKNCERILEGIDGFGDDTTFCLIYATDKDDRWDSEESLQKANPNWNVSIEPNHMLADMRDAQARASQQSKFRTKHLNEWVSVKEAFFNSVEWSKLERKIKREDFKDRPCYLAGDLASKHDIVALMQLFALPDKRYAIFGKYYLPEATLDLPENQHYRNWHLIGALEKAGGEITDLDVFKEDAITLCRDFQVEEFPFDPNRAWGVFPALAAEGLPVVEYRNTVLTMSEPMKQLDALIRSGRIIHDGDPVLAWAIANVTGRLDKKDNVYPNKEAPQNKIDPVIGLLMALGRAMTRNDEYAGPMFDF
jgi:phage terminase large subunit-like protein